MLALTGDRAAARALYGRVVERTGAPEFLDALAALEEEAGDRASAARRRGEARALYEKRLAQAPEAAAGHALDHFLGDAADAPRALRARPRQSRGPALRRGFRSALAKAWLHAGEPAKAKALLEGEIAKGWDTPELHWVLAGALEKLGRQAPAQASPAAALARNPAAARLYGAP